MSRPLRSKVLARVSLAFVALPLVAAACSTEEGEGGAPGGDAASEVGEIAQATTCPPSLVYYPIRGAHNTGYDTKAANRALDTCGDANSNTDFLGGDHYGIDIFAAKGTPVIATVSGTIKYADFSAYSGNRVTIIDACGWSHYYGHLLELGPGLVKGGHVEAGQLVGSVGATGTSSNGSVHLHFSLFPDGVYNNGVDPWPYLKTVEHDTCGTAPGGGAQPVGFLDNAGCDTINGWSQDPDAKTDSVPVHLYFNGPAGDLAAIGRPIVAGVSRGDLCGPLGSCNHGFINASPFGLFDGQPHAVHAYGIDVTGQDPKELASSPQQLNCPPTLPGGVKRWIINPDSLTAWGFDLFQDRLPAPVSEVDKIPDGPSFPTTPSLVQVEGNPAVFIEDGPYKHHIPNEAILAAWRLPYGDVKFKSQAEVDALITAAPVRARPVLAFDSIGRLNVIDDPLPALPTPPDPPPTAGAAGAPPAAGGAPGAAGMPAAGGSPPAAAGAPAAGGSPAAAGAAGAPAAGGNAQSAGAAGKSGGATAGGSGSAGKPSGSAGASTGGAGKSAGAGAAGGKAGGGGASGKSGAAGSAGKSSSPRATGTVEESEGCSVSTPKGKSSSTPLGVLLAVVGLVLRAKRNGRRNEALGHSSGPLTIKRAGGAAL